jgi:ribosome-binding protein aMBF1 (putative translation factor)
MGITFKSNVGFTLSWLFNIMYVRVIEMHTEEELLIKIGSTIKTERIRNGLSQADLAEQSNLHKNFIGMVERGQRGATITSLQKICLALGISLGEFFQSLNL